MRYQEIVVEQAGSANRFPILLSALPDDKQRARFLAAVQTAEAGKAAGAIPNVQFQDAKQTINHAFDRVLFRNADKLGWTYGRFNNPYPELHTVLGLQKKLRGDDNPQLVAFINEIAPLGTLFNELKGMVTKRQPKPVEEVKPGYHPPPVSSAAQAAVVKLLDQVTQETYEALRQHIIEFMRRSLTAYLEGHDAAVAAGKAPPSAHDFFVRDPQRKGGIPNYEAARIVDKLVIRRRDDYRPTTSWMAKPEAEVRQIAEAEATKQADQIRTAFVHKNYRKIASIIDAKGNYESGAIVGRGINLQGMDGTLRFHFADGSQFVVTNKVVYKVSNRGTPFLQFPLTFHDVVLPNGQKMPRPSEERMNSVFVQGG